MRDNEIFHQFKLSQFFPVKKDTWEISWPLYQEFYTKFLFKFTLNVRGICQNNSIYTEAQDWTADTTSLRNYPANSTKKPIMMDKH